MFYCAATKVIPMDFSLNYDRTMEFSLYYGRYSQAFSTMVELKPTPVFPCCMLAPQSWDADAWSAWDHSTQAHKARLLYRYKQPKFHKRNATVCLIGESGHCRILCIIISLVLSSRQIPSRSFYLHTLNKNVDRFWIKIY